MSVQELLEIKDLEHQIGQEDSKQSSMVAEYSSPLVHMHSASKATIFRDEYHKIFPELLDYLSVDDREGARCPTPSPLQEEKEIQIKKEEDEELEIADVSDDQYEDLSDVRHNTSRLLSSSANRETTKTPMQMNPKRNRRPTRFPIPRRKRLPLVYQDQTRRLREIVTSRKAKTKKKLRKQR